jgi:hypothetical protein
MDAFAWSVVIHTWFVVMAILIGINVGAFLLGYRGEHL